MACNSNNQYTPCLRFPEFDGVWQNKQLAEVFDFRNGFTPSKNIPENWEGGTIPWFRLDDIRDNGSILEDSVQHITPTAVKGTGLFKANSLIVATSATIGVHALVKVDHLANQRFTNLVPKEEFANIIDILYAYYYMFIVDEICKADTNIGTFASVNMTSFSRIPFPIPPTLDEQRKIASCLFEIDTMIADKDIMVKSLKAHKKGLMQQLFPQHGSTNPVIRFPGFSGEWREIRFEDICHTLTPPIKLQSSQYLISGRYPIVDQSQRLICGWTNDSDGLVKTKPLIVFGDHTCVLKYIDFPFVQGADGLKILEATQGNDPRFVYQLLLSNPVKQDGYKRHFSDLKEKTFFLPPTLDEQYKIAECFSALDEVIVKEEEMAGYLKSHKKGLMQQLFPQLDK